MRMYWVRHGVTAWNEEGRFQGKQDIPLNARGRAQARRVGEAFAARPLDHVYASPLSRARETAEAVACRLGLAVELLPRAAEIDHGEWEGCLAADVARRWPELLRRWHEMPQDVRMPGETGESLEDVLCRAKEALEHIRDRGGDEVLLVAHDAVLKVLLCHLLEMPLSGFWKFQLGNGSITVLEERSGGWRFSVIGDMCHMGDAFVREEQKGL